MIRKLRKNGHTTVIAGATHNRFERKANTKIVANALEAAQAENNARETEAFAKALAVTKDNGTKVAARAVARAALRIPEPPEQPNQLCTTEEDQDGTGWRSSGDSAASDVCSVFGFELDSGNDFDTSRPAVRSPDS